MGLVRRNQSGSITVPLVILLGILGATALGLGQLLETWRDSVEVQLTLDRCVGKEAHHLRDVIDRTETTNTIIKGIRYAIYLAIMTAQLELVSPLQKALKVAGWVQDAFLYYWRGKQALWIIERCGGDGTIVLPLPSLPWKKDPPDWIGYRPLRWTAPKGKEFFIDSRRGKATSGSKVSKKGQDDWKTFWNKSRLAVF